MRESSDFNIFDAAAQRSKKKSTPAPIEKKTAESSEKTAPSGENINEMIERMHKMHTDLQANIESTFDKAHFTPKELEKFLKTMTGGEEQKKNRLELEEKVWRALGDKFKAEKARQEQDKASKARKSKTVGARKSWLPMK